MEQSLAEALRKRMGDRGQEEFATYLGVSQGYLSGLLRGHRTTGLTRTARAIVTRYPELLPLFLPENITISIEQSQEA